MPVMASDEVAGGYGIAALNVGNGGLAIHAAAVNGELGGIAEAGGANAYAVLSHRCAAVGDSLGKANDR